MKLYSAKQLTKVANGEDGGTPLYISRLVMIPKVANPSRVQDLRKAGRGGRDSKTSAFAYFLKKISPKAFSMVSKCQHGLMKQAGAARDIHELEDPFDSTDLPLPSSPKQSSCRSARETSRIIDTSNLTAPLHDESVNSSDILPSLEASGSVSLTPLANSNPFDSHSYPTPSTLALPSSLSSSDFQSPLGAYRRRSDSVTSPLMHTQSGAPEMDFACFSYMGVGPLTHVDVDLMKKQLERAEEDRKMLSAGMDNHHIKKVVRHAMKEVDGWDRSSRRNKSGRQSFKATKEYDMDSDRGGSARHHRRDFKGKSPREST
ncbi:hypothetical protein ADUPG1_008279, partial [Aduncisulcus paluster]